MEDTLPQYNPPHLAYKLVGTEKIAEWLAPYTWDKGLAILDAMQKSHVCSVRHYEGLIVCRCNKCGNELNITSHSVKGFVGVWLQFNYDTMASESLIDPIWKDLYFAPDSASRLLHLYKTMRSYLYCNESI